jgi:hypothetical protein
VQESKKVALGKLLAGTLAMVSEHHFNEVFGVVDSQPNISMTPNQFHPVRSHQSIP